MMTSNIFIKYNSERGVRMTIKHNISMIFRKYNLYESKIYGDVRRESVMLYCMRGDLDLEWWDMMTDENIGGGYKMLCVKLVLFYVA